MPRWGMLCLPGSKQPLSQLRTPSLESTCVEGGASLLLKCTTILSCQWLPGASLPLPEAQARGLGMGRIGQSPEVA